MNQFALISLVLLMITGCNGRKEDRNSIAIGEKSDFDFFNTHLIANYQKNQTFNINPSKDTLLTTNSGMILKIFANTFLISPVDSVNQITVELIELNSKTDFAHKVLTEFYKNDLDRQNKISLSEKLIYVNATLNNTNLKIRPTKEIGVIIPSDTIENSVTYRNGYNTYNKRVSLSTMKNSQIKYREQNFRKFYFSTVSLDYPDKFLIHEDFDNNNHDWFSDPKRKIGDTLAIKTYLFDTTFAFDTSSRDVKMTYIEDLTIDSARIFKNAKNSFVNDLIWERWNDRYYVDYDSNYFFIIKESGWNNLARITTGG